MFTGKKTYALSAGMILTGIGGVLSGQLSPFEALLMILNGGAFASVRAGVASEVKKAK